MSCDDNKVLNVSYKDFERQNTLGFTEADNYTSLFIYSNEWVIYPPNNEMPPNAIYFNIPKEIKQFRNLRDIVIVNVFITTLPRELISLKNIKNFGFKLCPKSDLENITSILKRIKSLEQLDVTGSVIAKNVFEKLKDELSNVKVVDNMTELK